MHGIPQAERLHQKFAGEGVAVVDLHTVFEHHDAMRAYGMRGTPTLVLIDRAWRICHQHFGRLDDLTVGAEVMRLRCETC